MAVRKPTKTILIVSVIVAVVIALMMGARWALVRNVCMSEQMMMIPDLAGAKVEVVYTNCDTLAKEEWVEVYFSRAAAKEESWFAGWRIHRTLILSYDPGGRSFADMPLPSIIHPAPSIISISLPEVCDINYRSRKWENIWIDFGMGKTSHPSKSK